MPGKHSPTLIKAKDSKGLNLKDYIIRGNANTTGLENGKGPDGSGNKQITPEYRERDPDNASHEKLWIDGFLVDIIIGLGVVVFVAMAWLIATPNALSKLKDLIK